MAISEPASCALRTDSGLATHACARWELPPVRPSGSWALLYDFRPVHEADRGHGGPREAVIDSFELQLGIAPGV